jgi:hypothetical protein
MMKSPHEVAEIYAIFIAVQGWEAAKKQSPSGSPCLTACKIV